MWRSVFRGLLAAGATAAALAGVSAQFAPGWRPGEDLPPLTLDPLAPADPCTAPVIREDLLDGSAWLVRPDDAATVPTQTAADPGVGDVTGEGAHVVVMIPGAGGASRETMTEQAAELAACGTWAITYDKAGPLAAVLRDFDAWEAQAREAIEAARSLPGAGRVGVMGWSEGGWIASRVLDSADFAVFAGAPIVTPAEQAAWFPDGALAGLPDAIRRIPAMILAQDVTPTWTREDSLPHLRASVVPLLGVWGSDDGVVPALEGIRRLRDARADAAVMVLPGAGHTLEGSPWAPQVSRWIGEPDTSVRGVPPVSTRSVPGLPASTWYTHPIPHLALTIAVGVAATIHHRRHHGTRTA
ncbi:MAG: alpha/beta hydrolase [bacterium]|nr:alpha/beta hydrolase [bacterium]